MAQTSPNTMNGGAQAMAESKSVNRPGSLNSDRPQPIYKFLNTEDMNRADARQSSTRMPFASESDLDTGLEIVGLQRKTSKLIAAVAHVEPPKAMLLRSAPPKKATKSAQLPSANNCMFSFCPNVSDAAQSSNTTY